MSTIQATNFKHNASASNNIVLDSSGNAAFANNVTVTGNMTSSGMVVPASSFLRNRIINGDMRIDQRNAGASVTPAASTEAYSVDRWKGNQTQSSRYSLQRNAGSVTPPTGFTNYLGATSLSAYSVLSSDTFLIVQPIEGFNVADLGWGTASALTVTLSFWVRSSLTGTFGGALTNSAGNRSYPYPYTISTANTWEYKTVTIPGDTTGTWLSDNGTGIQVRFGLGSGSNFTATASAWGASNAVQPAGSVSVVGTNGATFYLTGVQLEVGSVATPFERRQYGTELMLCQRYYETSGSGFASALWNGYAQSGSIQYAPVMYKVTKRANPTITLTANASYNNLFPTTAGTATNITTENFYVSKVANGTGQGGYFSDTWTAAAEL